MQMIHSVKSPPFNPRHTPTQITAKQQIGDGIIEVARALNPKKLRLNNEKTEFLIVLGKRFENMTQIDSLQLGNDVVLLQRGMLESSYTQRFP